MQTTESVKGAVQQFDGIEDYELNHLVETQFHPAVIAPYTLIAQRDKKIEKVGYIESGCIDLYARSDDGRTTLKGSLGHGDFFGVESLFDKGISFFDEMSTEKVQCLTIAPEKLMGILSSHGNLKTYFGSLVMRDLKRVFSRPGLEVKEKTAHPDLEDGRLKKCLAFINSHYMEDIRLDDAAKLSGLSRFHFSRTFRQITGQTFKNYLNTKRVEAAKRLLSLPGVNISQACYSVGFNDASYFARCFKKFEGVSPSRFRKTWNFPESIMKTKQAVM